MTASSAARSSGDPSALPTRTGDRLLALIARTLRAARWRLAFPDELEARFEAETGERRVRHLRRSILVGLVVFHLYGWAAYVTTPDVTVLNLVLRIGLMTPVALGIYAALDRVGARTREALCGLGILGAALVPVLIFWLGHGPNVAHGTTAIWLTVIFANISLALRFSWACIASGGVAVVGCLAVAAHPEIAPDLADLIRLDMLIGIAFSLGAAHRIENTSRRNYLYTLQESLRAQQLVVANARLTRLSTTDPLTGLANRRAFAQRLDALWQASRRGDPFALMLVDVDHFKRFNDHYGHGAGDACLCEIARLLRGWAGGGANLVSRYGGEEFALLLPGLDSAAAIALAEGVRGALHARALPHAGRGDGLDHVTVSVGVAASSDGAATPAALVEAADAGLYAAKSAGRNGIGCERAPRRGGAPALAAWPFGGTQAQRRSA